MLQIASSLVLVEVLDLLLAKYDFLNILGSLGSLMENYVLGNIIVKVCSGSLLKFNMEPSMKIVANLWKSLTCVEKISI